MQMYKDHAMQAYGQLTLEGESASRDEIPIKKGGKWTFIDPPEVIQSMLRELATDVYGYDLRNWREAGITPEEIRLRYEHPELNRRDEYVWNPKKLCHEARLLPDAEKRFPVVDSRYFTWILPRLRKAGVPTETVVKILIENREKAWRTRKEWKLAEIKRMNELRKQYGDHDHYFDTSESAWRIVREMCRLLGEKPPRKPRWMGRRPKREEG